MLWVCASTGVFQFALPHGERHEILAKLHRAIGVSIRAPAWGATTIARRFGTRAIVSIRAPAWGATVESVRLNHPRGVSIRAPAWGATMQGRPGAVLYGQFQFALPHGERRMSIITICANTGGFNSRSRMGSDVL